MHACALILTATHTHRHTNTLSILHILRQEGVCYYINTVQVKVQYLSFGKEKCSI